MSALDRGLRRELAKAVRAARKTAETGARNALTALTVAAAEPDPSLSEEERALRRRLRAHGRQLGDLRQGAEQEVGRLGHEIAYEHWHRMLFARFLAENGLLVDPAHEIPVSLDECRDIARESHRDIWAVAAEFAAAMLPRIFRPDNPSLAVRLPPETQRELERTLAGLPSAVFFADDALGWTYQFWQADRKDEVNRSGVKIGANELPVVTQLFTEPYMVRFLFHNTVGAWRAGRLLADRPELAANAKSEDDLRRAIRLEAEGGYDFDYLRFVRKPLNETDGAASSPWQPAAGSFDEWPARSFDLRVLDPCCGSGHFLVEGLHLFVRLRMEEDDLSVSDAVQAVLRDNLHGLEIDPRCAQVAAFSVAFSAWKLCRRAIELPFLRIACSGLAPNATKGQWLALAETDHRRRMHSPDERNTRAVPLPSDALRNTFSILHDLFVEAPTLGSLIDPRQTDESVFAGDFDRIRSLLRSILTEEETSAEHRERAVVASGIAEASDLLANTFSLVITNVPYLARRKQRDSLRRAAEIRFPTSKGDLATMFVERAFRWTKSTGVTALVVPQNWLFIKTFRKLRESLLTQRRWRLVARLGEHAFEDVSAAGAFAAMTIFSADAPRDNGLMAGIDVSSRRGQAPILASDKASLLRGELDTTSKTSSQFTNRGIRVTSQQKQLTTPDLRISLSGVQSHVLLESYADGITGLVSKDTPYFFRQYWELGAVGRKTGWDFLHTTVNTTRHFGGMEQAVLWESGTGILFERVRSGYAALSGRAAWSKRGVLVSQIGELPSVAYRGHLFDMNVAVVCPKGEHLDAIWCFCSSPDYAAAVREIDQNLKVTNATLVKVPFDLERWQQVAKERYPHGLPEPYSDHPTQWIFHGHPCGSVVWDEEVKDTTYGANRTDATVLQVAVARLLGYCWPAESDDEMPLAEQQRAWVERSADLSRFADKDGIVCLPAVRGEGSAADRLRAVLVAAYGDEWSPATEQHLLRAANTDDRPVESLDDWLRQRFFAEHCRLFHHRPFVWHIWDGLPDGFHALVNYHRLVGPNGEGRGTLEALTFSYLGDWIERQRAAQREEISGAEARLVAALELQGQLERILKGEPPLDLFIRWKPLHRQPLGWEPDVGDGVRLNIRPFMRAKLRKGGRRGAGLLRAKPTIHWTKDRGREPEKLRGRSTGDPSRDIRPRTDFPWFWGCPGTGVEHERTDFVGGAEFDGNRWNDLHYTLAAKRAARERHERESAERPSDDAAADGTENESKTA